MTTVPHPTDTAAVMAAPPQNPVVSRVATAGPACPEDKTAPAATGAYREMDVNKDKVAPHGTGVNAFAYPLVDPEFVALLPPLTRDQKAGLEELIVAANEITHPLIVWAEERLLVDGHHRREIAMRLGMDFRTKEMSFPSREAVIEWMFKNQRNRRNLTPDQLGLVMGRHYNRAKKQGGQAWSAGRPLQQNVEGSGSTSDRLAKDYGVSDMTIQRAGKFAAAVDTLRTIDPEIEQRVVTGKGPTRKAVIAAAEALLAVVPADAGEGQLLDGGARATANALSILSGATKPEPRKHSTGQPKETVADRRGFKNLPRRAAQERAEAALMMLETALEGLDEINPERLNGERSALAERLCKAAQELNRIKKNWNGDVK